MQGWWTTLVAGSAVLLGGCAQGGAEAEPRPVSPTRAPAAMVVPQSVATAPAGPTPSDGAPQRARLSIPALDLDDLVVEPYVGKTDDAAGTEIQDDGAGASPHGPAGGVGPGGIGNYQVTAHRTSSTRAFEFLPDLRKGDRVSVQAGETTYVYRIVGTRSTSFRTPASLRAQRAAVPGKPGATPTRAMITLSTCATREDHAVGNYWSDEFHNPEHRIDKIGVLIATRPL